MKKTVVSLTPMPLDRDSRTLKIATSLARLGYRSVVVENLPSAPGRQTGEVEVVTLPGRRPAPASADPTTAAPPRPAPWLRERLHFLVFLASYFIWRPLAGLSRVPRADLYYVHEYRLFPLVWLLRLMRGRIPVIYDAHDIYQEVEASENLSPFWRAWFLPLLGRMEHWTSRHAKAVVTVGDGVGRRISAYLGKPCFVLRNCHDARLDQPSPWSLRQRAGVAPDDFLIVVIGNHKPGQAIEPLIAALARVTHPTHVVFLGRAYDQAPVLAQRHGVADRVHWVGPAQPECIVSCASEADAAALLYWPETENVRNILPNGFFQSLSAGLPLLYPPLPEILNIVRDRSVGREIDPQDVDSLHNALEQMTCDAEARDGWRRQAAALAEETGWIQEEKRLAALVAGILAGKEWPW